MHINLNLRVHVIHEVDAADEPHGAGGGLVPADPRDADPVSDPDITGPSLGDLVHGLLQPGPHLGDVHLAVVHHLAPAAVGRGGQGLRRRLRPVVFPQLRITHRIDEKKKVNFFAKQSQGWVLRLNLLGFTGPGPSSYLFNLAGEDHHTVVGGAAEVGDALHGAIVVALCRVQGHSSPGPSGENDWPAKLERPHLGPTDEHFVPDLNEHEQKLIDRLTGVGRDSR